MSQLDIAIYFPFFFWFVVLVFVYYLFLLICIVPNIYKVLRLRDIYIKELGNNVFTSIGSIYVWKKLFSYKLFTYRINDYFIYLFKKLKN